MLYRWSDRSILVDLLASTCTAPTRKQGNDQRRNGLLVLGTGHFLGSVTVGWH